MNEIEYLDSSWHVYSYVSYFIASYVNCDGFQDVSIIFLLRLFW